MADDSLTVALIHEVFHGPEAESRLRGRLDAARAEGAELALLPELPLQSWAPATRRPRDEDAEAPGGPLHRIQSEAASRCRIGLLGGVIVRDPASARRFNRALLFDARGALAAWYDKCHIPLEDGFWEGDHYEAGDDPPRRIDAFGMPLGLQICSDLNRPFGTLLLRAQGVEAILAPRATPAASYERWRRVIRAGATTSATYVLSTNRPQPESGVPIGGPSLAVGPDGAVQVESTEPLSVLGLERSRVARAREDYPGYLDVRADLYARAWAEVRS
jgi:predicted amidohydrolase